MCSLWWKWLVADSLPCAKYVLVVTYIKYFQLKKIYNHFIKFCCHWYNSSLQFNKEKAHRLEKCPLTANKLGLNAYDLINVLKFHSGFAAVACTPEKRTGSLPNNKWIQNIPRLGSCHRWSRNSQICNRNVCKLLEVKSSARANPFKQTPRLTRPTAEQSRAAQLSGSTGGREEMSIQLLGKRNSRTFQQICSLLTQKIKFIFFSCHSQKSYVYQNLFFFLICL